MSNTMFYIMMFEYSYSCLGGRGWREVYFLHCTRTTHRLLIRRCKTVNAS